MSKFTIHNNEYKRIKTNLPQKKAKWICSENLPLFHRFSQNEPRSKNQIAAEKKLSLVGWNFEILEKKFSVTTNLVHIFDLSGYNLWMNSSMKNTFFSKEEDPILMPNFLSWLEFNEKHSKCKDFQKILQVYPDYYEFEDYFQTKLGNLFGKVTFTRHNKPNGDPLFYLKIITLYPNKNTEESIQKKQKTKKEIITSVLKEFEIDHETFSPYEKLKDPVIFICLLGRVLWMNQTYIKVNLQSEDDLFETLNGKFGFEVFEEAFQLIQKNVPETFEYSSIEFTRYDLRNGTPFAYFARFKELVQIPNSILDLTDEMLKKCGCSIKKCKEKYDKEDRLHQFCSLEGRIIWMNLKYSEWTSQSNEMIMFPTLYSMIQSNPENLFLQEDFVDFIKKRKDTLYYYASINLENGRVLEAKFLITRIDTLQGIPIMYHIEIQPVLKEK